jgi:hypothetical protein
VDWGGGKEEREKIHEGTAVPVLLGPRSPQAKGGKYMKQGNVRKLPL